MARVEVRDAESEVYIPEASVSIVFPIGKVTKKTDAGGNVAFSRIDLPATSPEDLRQAFYRVENWGYESLEKPFAEGQITTFMLPRAKATNVPGASVSMFPTTAVLAVGGIAALGLIAFLTLK